MLYCRGAVAGFWCVLLMTVCVAIWHNLRESAIILTYISYKIIIGSIFIGILLVSGVRCPEYYSRDTYR